MHRLRALASWMTTGVVTLALALAVVMSGQLTKSPSLVVSSDLTTSTVHHGATVVVTHHIVRPAVAKLVDTAPLQRRSTPHRAPKHSIATVTTTPPSTTTSSTTSTTTSTSTTTTSTTTLPLPPVTTTTRPHHHGDEGGDGGGGSDDPPGSD